MREEKRVKIKRRSEENKNMTFTLDQHITSHLSFSLIPLPLIIPWHNHDQGDEMREEKRRE